MNILGLHVDPTDRRRQINFCSKSRTRGPEALEIEGGVGFQVEVDFFGEVAGDHDVFDAVGGPFVRAADFGEGEVSGGVRKREGRVEGGGGKRRREGGREGGGGGEGRGGERGAGKREGKRKEEAYLNSSLMTVVMEEPSIPAASASKYLEG
jgi:hypothetical protein